MNHIMRRDLPMTLLVVAIACAWPTVSFTVQPLLIDDSHTVSAGDGVNQVHGKRATIHVTSRFTGFLQFDLSTLPAGTTSANIEKATLSLFVTRRSVEAPGSFDIRLVTGPWNESTITGKNSAGLVSASVVTGIAIDTADGTWVSLNTAGTSGNDAIYADYATFRRDWDPELYARIKTTTSSANIRHFVGMYSADPSGAATNNTIHQAGFRFDARASDTKWPFCTGDGTTQACTDTGVTVSASTAYTLAVVCTVTGTNQCLGYINGSLVATRTTNQPGATTTVGYHVGTSTLTAASRSLLFGRLAILHK